MRPEELSLLRESRRRFSLFAVVGGIIFVWSSIKTSFNPVDVFLGVPDMLNLVMRMLPPRWSYFPQIIDPLLQTAQMAILGTLAGAVLAAPMMFLTARNTAGHPAVYRIARGILNLFRTIPDGSNQSGAHPRTTCRLNPK